VVEVSGKPPVLKASTGVPQAEVVVQVAGVVNKKTQIGRVAQTVGRSIDFVQRANINQQQHF